MLCVSQAKSPTFNTLFFHTQKTLRTRERNYKAAMNHQETQEHHVVQNSQLYTELYTQMVPQQGNLGEEKPRRRRRTKGSDAVEKKRKLTAAQVHVLERNFESDHKLESDRKERLAAELGLDPRQVAVWFQNRRARWRNKKLEEEYCNLKKLHESVVVEKYHLETEIFKLKEQLSEVEKEKAMLMMGERADGPLSSSSPSPSMPMEAVDPTCLGQFGTSYYMSENTSFYGMEFAYPYI